eukprot:gene11331-23715_t
MLSRLLFLIISLLLLSNEVDAHRNRNSDKESSSNRDAVQESDSEFSGVTSAIVNFTESNTLPIVTSDGVTSVNFTASITVANTDLAQVRDAKFQLKSHFASLIQISSDSITINAQQVDESNIDVSFTISDATAESIGMSNAKSYQVYETLTNRIDNVVITDKLLKDVQNAGYLIGASVSSDDVTYSHFQVSNIDTASPTSAPVQIIISPTQFLCDLFTNSNLNDLNLGNICQSSGTVIPCTGSLPAFSFISSCSDSGSITGLAFSGLNLNPTDTFNIGLSQLNLQSLIITQSNFIGNSIPTSFSTLITIQTLTLSQNNLQGELPTSTLLGMWSLKHLNLMKNSFTGQIPLALGAIDFITIDLSDNNLSGIVPDSFCSNNALNTFDTSGNSGLVCIASCLNNVPNHNYGALSVCTATPTVRPTVKPSTSSPTSTGICVDIILMDKFGDGWDSAQLLNFPSRGAIEKHGDYFMLHTIGYKPAYAWEIFWQVFNPSDGKTYTGNYDTVMRFEYQEYMSGKNLVTNIVLESSDHLIEDSTSCESCTLSNSPLTTSDKPKPKPSPKKSKNKPANKITSSTDTTTPTDTSSASAATSTLTEEDKSLPSIKSDLKSTTPTTTTTTTTTSDNDTGNDYVKKATGPGIKSDGNNNNINDNMILSQSNDDTITDSTTKVIKTPMTAVAAADIKPTVSSSTSTTTVTIPKTQDIIDSKPDNKPVTPFITPSTISSSIVSDPKISSKSTPGVKINDKTVTTTTTTSTVSNEKDYDSYTDSSSSSSDSSSETAQAVKYSLTQTNGTWYDAEGFGTKFFLSDMDGEEEMYSGTLCGSNNMTCQVFLTSGKYSWRVTGLLSNGRGGQGWSICGASGSKSTELIIEYYMGACYVVEEKSLVQVCENQVQVQQEDVVESDNTVTLTGIMEIVTDGSTDTSSNMLSLLSEQDRELLTHSITAEFND